jgi:hypothetical protein
MCSSNLSFMLKLILQILQTKRFDFFVDNFDVTFQSSTATEVLLAKQQNVL